MRRMCIFKSQYGRRGGTNVLWYELSEEEEEESKVNVYLGSVGGSPLYEGVPISEIDVVYESMVDFSAGQARFKAQISYDTNWRQVSQQEIHRVS